MKALFKAHPSWREKLQLDPADAAIIETHNLYCYRSERGYHQVRAHRKGGGERGILARILLRVERGQVVDHINGDPLDNRRANLRICTPSDNAKNRGKQVGSSRYKGLTWYNGKWFGQIAHNGRKVYLGLFVDEVEGALAYDRAARELHGDFARLNFSDHNPGSNDNTGPERAA